MSALATEHQHFSHSVIRRNNRLRARRAASRRHTGTPELGATKQTQEGYEITEKEKLEMRTAIARAIAGEDLRPTRGSSETIVITNLPTPEEEQAELADLDKGFAAGFDFAPKP
jgi:hypothetical protein